MVVAFNIYILLLGLNHVEVLLLWVQCMMGRLLLLIGIITKYYVLFGRCCPEREWLLGNLDNRSKGASLLLTKKDSFMDK